MNMVRLLRRGGQAARYAPGVPTRPSPARHITAAQIGLSALFLGRDEAWDGCPRVTNGVGCGGWVAGANAVVTNSGRSLWQNRLSCFACATSPSLRVLGSQGSVDPIGISQGPGTHQLLALFDVRQGEICVNYSKAESSLWPLATQSYNVPRWFL